MGYVCVCDGKMLVRWWNRRWYISTLQRCLWPLALDYLFTFYLIHCPNGKYCKPLLSPVLPPMVLLWSNGSYCGFCENCMIRNLTNFPDFHWFCTVESIGSGDVVLVPDGNVKSSQKVAAQALAQGSPRDRGEDCRDDDGLSAEQQQGKGALEPADGERSPLLPSRSSSSSSSSHNDATLGR
jgi:hypothetical protein